MSLDNSLVIELRLYYRLQTKTDIDETKVKFG